MHGDWVAALNAHHQLGPDRQRVSEYSADVVETLFVRPAGITGALSRFGSRLGNDGWTLETASSWIDSLGELLVPEASGRLRSFESGVALANGWTEGHLRGLRSDECFDGVTGLCTTSVLRLRLQQLFDQCAALEIEPNWLNALVIFDTDLSDLPGLEADAAMVVLADLVQQAFTCGETIIRERNRVFVLCIRDEHLAAKVGDLVDTCGRAALLRAARVLGWVDNLPDKAASIDGYMADLVMQ